MNKSKTKKLLLISLLAIGLTACSSENNPATQKLSKNVRIVSSTTVLSVISADSYPLPENGQVVSQYGRFKTIDEIYDAEDNNILIPSGAIIQALYTNNGIDCTVAWKAVYVSSDENDNEDDAARNEVSLSHVTRPSICHPERGIKSGDRLTISFTDGATE